MDKMDTEANSQEGETGNLEGDGLGERMGRTRRKGGLL